MSVKPISRAIVGGTIIDGTGAEPVKDGILVIEGGRIAAVGGRGEVDIPPGSEIIEASGRTVLPGFIDAHTHFLSMGVGMLRHVDLGGASSLAEALERVRARLAATPRGGWVLGRGWDESGWPERRYIARADLDPLSPDNPVMLIRVDGHLIVLNSRALGRAGITRGTPDPPGGRVDKGEDGEPTGILRDARHLVEEVLPPVTEEESAEGLRHACDRALSLGCTGVHEAGLDAPGLDAYQSAMDGDILRVRAYLMTRGRPVRAALGAGAGVDFEGGMLRLGAVKLMADGSLGARTAALFEPYHDDPSSKGLLVTSPDELEEEVEAAHRAGLQVAVHAIGDRGIEHAIKAIEGALRRSPRKDHRHRIEHCELPTAGQIERMGRLGIVASLQPNFVGIWSGPGGLYEVRLGVRRLRGNNPFRALLDEGIRVAFGSDCMPFGPLFGVWSAVNHPVKGSRITLGEAVRCYTLEAAYASFEEERRGSLEPGKLADIVVLDEDLTQVPADHIKDVSVRMTIVNGGISYSKGLRD